MMKKLATLFVVAFIAFLATSCGPTTDQAIAYNDDLIAVQTSIIDKINELDESLGDWEDKSGMDKAFSVAVKEVETGTATVKEMKDFKDGTEFRDAVLELFGVYKSVLEKEYTEMIAIYKLPEDLYTTEQEDKWNKLHDDAFEKMDDALEDTRAAQEKFSKKYNFDIEK